MLLKIIAGIAVFLALVIYCCIIVGKRVDNDWKQLQDAFDNPTKNDVRISTKFLEEEK